MKKGYLWILASILFRTLASICAKQAGLSTSNNEIYKILINPWYFAELILLISQAISWIMVLRRFTLSFAYPFMSLTIILNLISAYFLFNEPISINNILGAFFITIGVIKISGIKYTKSRNRV